MTSIHITNRFENQIEIDYIETGVEHIETVGAEQTCNFLHRNQFQTG